MDDFLSRVSFPLAAKPRKGSGSAGFKKIHTREELDQYIADGDIVPEERIQEFILDKYMCNCYVMMDDQRIPCIPGPQDLPLVSRGWRPWLLCRTVDQRSDRKRRQALRPRLERIRQVSFMMDSRDNTPRSPRSTVFSWHQDHGIWRTPVLYMLEAAGDEAQRDGIRQGLGLRYFHRHSVAFKSPTPR